jgi:hypothetical protein
MGLQMRDDRQLKALTGLSQAQCDHRLPGFRAIYRATPPQLYEEGVVSGTRRRRPGGGATGQLPTIADTWPFVLYYYQPYPPFDVLGTQCARARSKAHEGSGHFRAKIYSKPEASVMRQHTAKKPPVFHTELHASWSIKVLKIDMPHVSRQWRDLSWPPFGSCRVAQGGKKTASQCPRPSFSSPGAPSSRLV